MADFLLIEPCNFEDYPVGGQLSFAKHLMAARFSRIWTRLESFSGHKYRG